MRTLLLATLLAANLTGCTVAGLLAGPDDFCRSKNEELPGIIADEVTSELRQEHPPGDPTYGPEAWNKHWNVRLHDTTKIGADDCDGSWKGPTGSEMVRAAIVRRREIGLPEIQLEDRNKDKAYLLQ